MTALLTVHLAVTIAMAGVIWSVQWVQYPLFARVGEPHFARYHETHVQRISYVVVPLMIVEVLTALALLLAPGALSRTAAIAGAILLAVAWVSTFAIQVPLHRRLSCSWNVRDGRRLVRSNWIRTAAWTGRAVILLGSLPTP